MKKKTPSRSAFLNPRVLLGLTIFSAGVFLTLLARANPPVLIRNRERQLTLQMDSAAQVTPASPGGVQEGWLARYEGSGNLDDSAQAIALDRWGNVYVTGFSVGSGTGFDYATIKYNSAGQEQWAARYNGPGNDFDEGLAIAVDDSGNVYVTGESWDPGTKTDYATIKYNPAGQQQWVTRYNGPGNDDDGATAIATDNSGNVYVTGFSVGSGVDYDYATIKYNPMGQEQWVARYDGPGKHWDLARDIAVDVSGNVYVTGNSVGTTYPDYDYATIKYNFAGQEQWVARYNGSGKGEDDASGLAIDGSGNVYVTGSSNGANSLPDYATIKYNSAGQEQWVARYDGPGNSYDIGRGIAVDEFENVYVTGNSFG